jgi:hypothetical protein
MPNSVSGYCFVKVKSEKLKVKLTAHGEAVTENFAQAFIKACDGVKGARSPLSLPQERNPLAES